jgi:hypothetical protein
VKRVFDKDHSIVTFATNKLKYLHFAFNCARSVLLFNDINIYIVTNIEAPVPPDLKEKVFLIRPTPEHAAMGICIKLFTIDYVQTLHTLFIDADCLCYGDLSPIFEAAKPMSVTVAGNIVPSANWVGDKFAKEMKLHWGIDKLIRFNGGMYYIKNNDTAKKIYATAQQIENEHRYGYDDINKKWVNEEAQISVAMMLQQQQPLPDDGRFFTDLFTDRQPKKLDILSGHRQLNNPSPPSELHRPWYPARYSPLILHFGGANLNSYPYNSQRILLDLYRRNFPIWAGALIVNIFINFPYKSWHWLTGSLRKLKIR